MPSLIWIRWIGNDWVSKIQIYISILIIPCRVTVDSIKTLPERQIIKNNILHQQNISAKLGLRIISLNSNGTDKQSAVDIFFIKFKWQWQLINVPFHPTKELVYFVYVVYKFLASYLLNTSHQSTRRVRRGKKVSYQNHNNHRNKNTIEFFVCLYYYLKTDDYRNI